MNCWVDCNNFCSYLWTDFSRKWQLLLKSKGYLQSFVYQIAMWYIVCDNIILWIEPWVKNRLIDIVSINSCVMKHVLTQIWKVTTNLFLHSSPPLLDLSGSNKITKVTLRCQGFSGEEAEHEVVPSKSSAYQKRYGRPLSISTYRKQITLNTVVFKWFLTAI